MAIKIKKPRVSAAKSRVSSAVEEKAGMDVPIKQISIEAYYNYLRRMKNNSPGNEMSDWLEAEKTVRIPE